MVIKVNVWNDVKKVCGSEDGWVAVAADMTALWAKAPTIDEAINQFKQQYNGLLEMQFQNNEKLEFDFHVIF